MVTKEETVTWFCDVCGTDWSTEQQAIDCEIDCERWAKLDEESQEN